MTIYRFTCVIITLFLLSTANGDILIDDDVQTCKELCEKCEGFGSYVRDGCECHINNKNDEMAECINGIMTEAAKQNLTLVNITPKILDRSSRCCPTNGRLKLSDILRVAKYFLNDGPRIGTRILGNRRSFDETMIDTADCQYCLDDEEDPDVDIGMPEEESIDGYLTPSTSLPQYIIEPQNTCSLQNAYPYNNYIEPHIASIDQIQSPHNCYSSLPVPPALPHEYPRDPLSSLLPSPHQLTQVAPLTPQVHLSSHRQHHLHRGLIEPSLTHLPASSYPQYSLVRVPHHDLANTPIRGIYRNSIRNPSYLYPSVSQLPGFGVRTRQSYRSAIPSWPRPIVQPLHTLPASATSQIGRSPQSNSLAWSPVMPGINIPYGINQQLMPAYSGFTGNNYPVEPLLGASNPNANQNNNINNNAGNIPNQSVQQKAIENYNENQSAMASGRSDIVVQPEQSTLESQTQMPPTLDNRLLINIPNTMKRTLPASLRYKQMSKRALKTKVFIK